MNYVDTSVALARLLAEDRRPLGDFWGSVLVSSRLLEYEVWSRINALGLARSHGEAVRQFLEHVSLVEMTSAVLERALEPFPEPVRTLDALHLATIEYLRKQGQHVALASYDQRMTAAARACGSLWLIWPRSSLS